jgi:murein L,D-transpeptidase YcbB/YkuD
MLGTVLFLTMGMATARWNVPLRLSPQQESTVARFLAETPFVAMAVGDVAAHSVRGFYERRSFRPIWIADPAQAERVKQALRSAAEHGMNPSDYAVTAPRPQAGSAEQAAYELQLTDGLLRFASDLRRGRVTPAQAHRDAQLPSDSFDPVTALHDALSGAGLAQFLAELPPPQKEYAALKQALARYRALVAKGGLPTVPAWAGLALGDAGHETLRRRLAFEEQDGPSLRAGELGAALRRFQLRNGLEPDGRLGPKTLAMLNMTAEQRVDQIVANMERWRWMPRQPEKRRIVVNVADASLMALERDEILLASRVIVGTSATPTPIFHAVVTAVTVNPSWTVPHSIARNEILPHLKRDHGYLQKHDMVLLDGPPGDPQGRGIDWKRLPAGSFPYRIRIRLVFSNWKCRAASASISTTRRAKRPSPAPSARSVTAACGSNKSMRSPL